MGQSPFTRVWFHNDQLTDFHLNNREMEELSIIEQTGGITQQALRGGCQREGQRSKREDDPEDGSLGMCRKKVCGKISYISVKCCYMDASCHKGHYGSFCSLVISQVKPSMNVHPSCCASLCASICRHKRHLIFSLVYNNSQNACGKEHSSF